MLHRVSSPSDPVMTDKNPRAVAGNNSRHTDVQRTAEEIAEIAKFLRNNAGPGAPYRSRALAVGAVSPISDAAFRLYALRLIFGSSEGEDIFPSQKTLGLLMGKNERHIRRLDDELKEELYPDIRLMNTMRRRRASATFNLISGVPMDRLIAELSGDLDRTEMSGQEAQDRTDLAGQRVKTGHFVFKTGQECPPTLIEDPIKEAAATGSGKPGAGKAVLNLARRCARPLRRTTPLPRNQASPSLGSSMRTGRNASLLG